MAAQNAPVEVKRLENADPDAFRRDFAEASRPAVIGDGFRYWPRAAEWRIERLVRRFRDRTLPAYELDGRVDLADQLEKIAASDRDDPEPYIRNINIITELPELLPDFAPTIPLCTPNRIGSPLLPSRLFPRDGHLLELFVGGPGSQFPYVHYDDPVMHTWSLLLEGTKEWTLFAPEDGKFLYPKAEFPFHSHITDPDTVDLERFPDYAGATPIKIVQKPGELLFVPAGWWHTAKNIEASLTVAWDQLCASNWSDYCDYVRYWIRSTGRPWRAVMAYSFLRGMGPVLSAYEAVDNREQSEPFWVAQGSIS